MVYYNCIVVIVSQHTIQYNILMGETIANLLISYPLNFKLTAPLHNLINVKVKGPATSYKSYRRGLK